MSNLKQFAEKAFTAAVTSVTAFVMSFGAFVPGIAHGASCVKQDPGTLIQVEGTTAVYLVDADGGRKYFPNSEVYHTWFSDFSQVVKIEPVCIDDYQSNGGVNFRPGSFLVKTDVSPNVYAIGSNNKKQKLSDPNIAEALYGPNWEKLIRVLPDAFDSNYKVGEPIIKAEPHDGMIVRMQGDEGVFIVENGAYKQVEPNDADEFLPFANEIAEEVFSALESSGLTSTKADIIGDPTQEGGLLITNNSIKVEIEIEVEDGETKTKIEIEIETETEDSDFDESDDEDENDEDENDEDENDEDENQVVDGEQTVNGLIFTDANYTGSFPAPEGMVLTGYVGKDTYTSPTGAGPYQYRVQTDWKRPLACEDDTRIRIGSKGTTWENGWNAGYNAGNAQFNSLVPTYNNTPLGSQAGNALYDEGYRVGYDHGWNDQTSVSTHYDCPNSSRLSKSEIEAAYDADGWGIFEDADKMPGLTLHFPQDAGVANTRSGIQVPGMTVRVQGNSDEDGPHTSELNKSLPMVNVDYIDFSVDTVGSAELSLGPEGVLQAVYDDIKQKDSNALCATSDASISTNTFGSNTVVSLDFFSACDVDGSSAVDIAWVPRHYSIIVGSNNKWLTMFISNNNDIGNDDNSAIDTDAYVNADFMTQFYTKLKFN